MSPKAEFLQRELAWVRVVRKTKRPEQLHLVRPATDRELEILAELRRLGEGLPSNATIPPEGER